jgi:TonB family protein
MRPLVAAAAGTLVLLGAAAPALAQAPEPAISDVAEQMPVLEGGLEGLAARLTYPEEARLAGIEGRVFVQFVVDEQGSPTDVTVIRGIGGGCDEAAAEAVRGSRFTPGRQGGTPVAVRMSLPVTFRLTEPPPAPAPPEVYEVVDQMPEVIGGIEALQRRIRYPDEARRAGTRGRVFVQFVVDERGVPTDIEVVRGIGDGCDEAAVAAVALSRFTPGRHGGRPVRVRMALPVTFRLY